MGNDLDEKSVDGADAAKPDALHFFQLATGHPSDLVDGAADVLDMINQPDVLERFESVGDLHTAIQAHGFQVEDSSLVTVGWARKVDADAPSKPTSALIQIGNSICKVGSGSSGNYYITT